MGTNDFTFSNTRGLEPAALIEQLQGHDADTRWFAATALGELKATEAVGALLVSLEDADAEVRRAAANALGRIGNRRVVNALRRVAEQDFDDEVRRSASQALKKEFDVVVPVNGARARLAPREARMASNAEPDDAPAPAGEVVDFGDEASHAAPSELPQIDQQVATIPLSDSRTLRFYTHGYRRRTYAGVRIFVDSPHYSGPTRDGFDMDIRSLTVLRRLLLVVADEMDSLRSCAPTEVGRIDAGEGRQWVVRVLESRRRPQWHLVDIRKWACTDHYTGWTRKGLCLWVDMTNQLIPRIGELLVALQQGEQTTDEPLEDRALAPYAQPPAAQDSASRVAEEPGAAAPGTTRLQQATAWWQSSGASELGLPQPRAYSLIQGNAAWQTYLGPDGDGGWVVVRSGKIRFAHDSYVVASQQYDAQCAEQRAVEVRQNNDAMDADDEFVPAEQDSRSCEGPGGMPRPAEESPGGPAETIRLQRAVAKWKASGAEQLGLPRPESFGRVEGRVADRVYLGTDDYGGWVLVVDGRVRFAHDSYAVAKKQYDNLRNERGSWRG